jgi:hypothetical protein
MDAFAQGEFVIGLAQNIGQGVGNALGALFDKSQKTNEAILKGIIETVLDAAHAALMAWYSVILAREIATKGAVGITSAAIYLGLIEAAYGVAKAALSAWNTSKDTSNTSTTPHAGPMPQRYAGKYPVLGADDRMTYWAEWAGNARTGIYGSPALIAERGPEMVIDYPTLRNMKMNAPGLIQAIMAMRVQQYGNGKYNSGKAEGFRLEAGGGNSQSVVSVGGDEDMKVIMSELRDILKGGIQAYVPMFGTNSIDEARRKIEQFNSKVYRK